MKKILSLLLLVLPMFALVSCHDDDGDSLPNVKFDISMDNATNVDGTLYMVAGDTLNITSIAVVNQEAGKQAMIGSANFYWDYSYLGAAIQPPYAFSIVVPAATPAGKHLLEIQCPLFAVDKEPATALIAYPVMVVDSISQMPQVPPTYAISVTPVLSKK